MGFLAPKAPAAPQVIKEYVPMEPAPSADQAAVQASVRQAQDNELQKQADRTGSADTRIVPYERSPGMLGKMLKLRSSAMRTTTGG